MREHNSSLVLWILLEVHMHINIYRTCPVSMLPERYHQVHIQSIHRGRWALHLTLSMRHVWFSATGLVVVLSEIASKH